MSTAFAIGRDVFAVIGLAAIYFLAASGVGRILRGSAAPHDSDERTGS